MNILPKKSWHVRNKDNIERVRKDEENAANEEKERQRRIALAESESRTELLRGKARERSGEETQLVKTDATNKHVNFFEEEEQGLNKTGGNEEYEKEKKEEQEKQEKAIGLLTYLGQSAVEAQTEKPWYFKAPSQPEKVPESGRKKTFEEFDLKGKSSIDPMNVMSKYVEVTRKRELGDRYSKPFVGPTQVPERKAIKRKRSPSPSSSSSSEEERRRKKHKKSKSKKKKKDKKKKSKARSPSPIRSGPSKTVQQLRAERTKREREEKKKRERVIAKAKGHKSDEDEKRDKVVSDRDRRYNSQFNPDLVRKPKKRRKNYMDMID